MALMYGGIDVERHEMAPRFTFINLDRRKRFISSKEKLKLIG